MSGSMKDLLGDNPYIYGGNPPAQKHSPTSIAAASAIKPLTGPLHKKILDYLEHCILGATDEEMQAALDMPANTQRPRRRELQLSGQIRDSGQTRLTGSRRSAAVWIIAR